MIRSFADKEAKKLFETERSRRFGSIARVAVRKLTHLDTAKSLESLRIPPGNRLEGLAGDRAGQYSIRINGQFRICFRWESGEAVDVEIVDYHGGAQMSFQRPRNGWRIKRKPVHPGEMLREEFLVPLDLSANRLAAELCVPVTRITEILNERRSITADTALRLERYFGMSAEFWLTLQQNFDLQTARQHEGAKVKEEVRRRTGRAA